MNCETIKQKIGIKTLLESFNLFPVKENRQTAFYFALDRKEKTPSFFVDFIKNTAFDFGTGKSYDVISIVQIMNRCTVSDALKYLENMDFSTEPASELNSEISSAKFYEIIRTTEVRHPALIQYLESRKVLEQKYKIKEVRYILKGKKNFGIGFSNNSGGMEVRNLYSKICLGKKDVTLIQNGTNKADEIIVFEGFFDYLTYLNLEKEKSCSDFLILNSTAMLFKNQVKLKEYNKISLFLDNDSNGILMKETIRNNYKNVEDCSLPYRDYKDLNEWFCSSENK